MVECLSNPKLKMSMMLWTLWQITGIWEVLAQISSQKGLLLIRFRPSWTLMYTKNLNILFIPQSILILIGLMRSKNFLRTKILISQRVWVLPNKWNDLIVKKMFIWWENIHFFASTESKLCYLRFATLPAFYNLCCHFLFLKKKFGNEKNFRIFLHFVLHIFLHLLISFLCMQKSYLFLNLINSVCIKKQGSTEVRIWYLLISESSQSCLKLNSPTKWEF